MIFTFFIASAFFKVFFFDALFILFFLCFKDLDLYALFEPLFFTLIDLSFEIVSILFTVILAYGSIVFSYFFISFLDTLMGYLVSMESSFFSIYLSTFFSKILGLIIYEPLFLILIEISYFSYSFYLGSYKGLLKSFCSFISSTGIIFFYFISISTGLVIIFTFFIASDFFKVLFFDALYALFFLCF